MRLEQRENSGKTAGIWLEQRENSGKTAGIGANCFFWRRHEIGLQKLDLRPQPCLMAVFAGLSVLVKTVKTILIWLV